MKTLLKAVAVIGGLALTIASLAEGTLDGRTLLGAAAFILGAAWTICDGD